MIWNSGLLLASLLLTGPADLDRKPDGVIYTAKRAFRVPLDLTDAERRQISAIRLFISEDLGRTWIRHSDGQPDMKVVTFKAERDGAYWFTIALVDRNGQQVPPDVRGVEPGLKIVVDSTKPEMVLKPVKSKTGSRGVRWELSDPNLDQRSLQLAVQENDVTGWRPFDIRHPERKIAWFADKAEVRKIQASISDLAGNQTVYEVEVHGDRFSKRIIESFVLDKQGGASKAVAQTAGSPFPSRASASASPPPTAPQAPLARSTPPVSQERGFGPPPPPSAMRRPAIPPGNQAAGNTIPRAVPRPDATLANTPAQPPAPPAASGGSFPAHTAASPAHPTPETLSYSADPKVMVYYEVENSARTRPTQVEVWGTRDDGRSWNRLTVDGDGISPAEVDLGSEGIWGLKVTVVGSFGPENQRPIPGTKPEMFVEIDTLRPYVELAAPEVSSGLVILRWAAKDKNLAQGPIHISYATAPSGPWQVLAERQENTGEYIWNQSRAGQSGSFYFRVEAVDKAGNSGSAQTAQPVAVGAAAAAPRGRVLGIRPSSGNVRR